MGGRINVPASKNLFWDSCVFIRYLVGSSSDAHFDDICQFVDDAKANKVKIYYSTIAYTEIRPRHLRAGKFGSMSEMLEDLGSSFIPIDPLPSILMWAGALKDAQAVNPGDPKEPPEKTRVIGTPDAIHLATCIFARDSLGISDVVFHTLDEGKGVSWEGRCIPLLGIDRWYPEHARIPEIRHVCSLNKEKPIHPQPSFSGVLTHGRNVDLGRSDTFGSA